MGTRHTILIKYLPLKLVKRLSLLSASASDEAGVTGGSRGPIGYGKSPSPAFVLIKEVKRD